MLRYSCKLLKNNDLDEALGLREVEPNAVESYDLPYGGIVFHNDLVVLIPI